MVEITKYRRLSSAAKKIIPLISPLLKPQFSQNALSLAETMFAVLQGRGAGTGWDIGSETRAALRFIPRGGLVFDLGANRGEWSREVLAAMQGDLRIVMFEPQTSCLPHLRDLIDKGATLVASAVGDHAGQAVLYSPGAAAGNASVHVRKDTFFKDQTFVPADIAMITLDGYIESNAIAKIDFMKMDIEGEEVSALNGARKALAAGIVRALSFEFGAGNLNSRTYFRDLWDLLTANGYSIMRIIPGGNVVPIRAYYEDMEYFRGVSNYIAVRPG